jgi:phage terminase large subunit
MPKPIDLPEKLWPLTKPRRFNVIYGGRGSGKSESVARLLIIKAMQTQRRILCCREFQVSIRESVHALLKSVIVSHDLHDMFSINFNSIKCNVTGSEFVFAGLAEHTVDSIKSLYGFTDVWVEEAQRLSKRSMDLLLPTIRAEGSVFYFTFNPELESDPVYKRFVSAPDAADDAHVIEMNYPDNPWFPEVLRVEMEASKRRSMEDYLHIWRGQTRSFTQTSILGHLIQVKDFEPEDNWTPYFGIDWGFAADPTALVKCFVHNRTLFIRNEFYGHGVEINDYAKCFSTVPGAIHGELWADNSRPESIAYLNQPSNFPDKRPLNVKAAPKWSGSVEDGIAWLRSLDAIVIHPECSNSAYELPRYSWKVDRLTGAILPVPASGWDHVVDSARYACSRFIKRKLNSFDIM